jgi:hypothetical protein
MMTIESSVLTQDDDRCYLFYEIIYAQNIRKQKCRDINLSNVSERMMEYVVMLHILNIL